MPFTKGQSGNPGGRPKVLAEIRELAHEHASQAISTLAGIMADPKADNRARIASAIALLDRGHGRPTQELTQHIDDQRILLRMPEDRELAAASAMERLRRILDPNRNGAR